MGEYKRIILLVVIMGAVALSVGGLAIVILYETALSEQRESLTTLLQRQVRLLDAFARYEERGGTPNAVAIDAAIEQLAEAHRGRITRANGGDLNLAQPRGDQILIRRFPRDPGQGDIVLAPGAPFAQPNRRAIDGESGWMYTVNEHGQDVLAVYEPFVVGRLGMVAALPLAEIQAPFARAGIAIVVLSCVLIALGTSMFFSVSEPMIEELRSREQRFRDLFENMNSGAMVLTAVEDGRDFVIRDLNAAAERIDDVARSDVIGQRLSAIFPGVVDTPLLDALARAARTGQSRDVPEFFYADERLTGWREHRLYRLRTGEIVSLFNDVSARKATEEQLLQAQKMEVVGQLTGGIAHDFNNVLAIILGNLQLLAERADFDAETRALIGDALWSAERGAELTHRLLAFARRQPLHPSLIDVNELVRRMLRLVRRTLGSSVVLEAELAARPALTVMDRGQLDNALMNLIINARDALSETGGAIIVATRDVAIDATTETAPATVDGRPLPVGDYVALDVRDNGHGIAPGSEAV